MGGMPEQIRGASLNTAEAIELVETLAFLCDWFAGTDHAMLAASLARFVGTDGYDLVELQADLARFSFLLGGDAPVADDQQ